MARPRPGRGPVTGIGLQHWLADEIGMIPDEEGIVAMTDGTTAALAGALRIDTRALSAMVRSLIEEHEPQPAFEMRTGGWRLKLHAPTAQAIMVGTLTATALRDLGARSLPVVALSAIGAALFRIERIEVTPSDLALHAELRQVGEGIASLAELHEELPRHVRDEVTPAQLADVVERLTDVGLTAWDDRGLLVRRPRRTRFVFGRGPSDAVLDRLSHELHPDGHSDRSQRVFVVHGRDLAFRDRFFRLLDAVGVRPLEWEPLVADLRSTKPYVLDVVREGLSPDRAGAAVVLMTPDDVAALHPSLHGPAEDIHELSPMLQPRQNVLVELGCALALFPDKTVVVSAGRLRPIGDLAGVNVIRFDGSADKIAKVVDRLKVAGCSVAVDEAGGDDLSALFDGLDTFDREPP